MGVAFETPPDAGISSPAEDDEVAAALEAAEAAAARRSMLVAVMLLSSAAASADAAVQPTEVCAVAGVDAVPGVAGVAVAEPECEAAEPPAGAGATTLRSMSSARSPVGAKYFAMMELIPLLLLSSSEKSS